MRQSGNQPGFSGFCSGILFSETTLISIQNCPITSVTQIFVFSVTVVNLVTNPSIIHSFFKIKPNPKKRNNDLLHFHTFSRLKWTKRINWNIQIAITIPFFPILQLSEKSGIGTNYVIHYLFLVVFGCQNRYRKKSLFTFFVWFYLKKQQPKKAKKLTNEWYSDSERARSAEEHGGKQISLGWEPPDQHANGY